MRKKFIVITLLLTLGWSTIKPALKVAATAEWNIGLSQSQIVESSKELIAKALVSKSFYDYNIAYTTTLDIDDQCNRELLLSKLGTISDMIYTPEIQKFCKALENIAANPNGRLYDEINRDIGSSNLNDMDKGYLLGELTGWGREKVFTDDYVKAVDAVVFSWNTLGSDSVNNAIDSADNAINHVNNQSSREYLKEQLQGVKDIINTPLIMPSDSQLLELLTNANEAIDKVVFSNVNDPNAVTQEGSYQILGSEFDSKEKVRSYLGNYFSEKIIDDFESIVDAGYREGKYTIFPYQGIGYNFKFIEFNKKEIINNKLFISVTASVFDEETTNLVYTLEKINGKIIFTFFKSYTGDMGDFDIEGKLTMKEAATILEKAYGAERFFNNNRDGQLVTMDGRECWQFIWIESLPSTPGRAWVDINTGEVKVSSPELNYWK